MSSDDVNFLSEEAQRFKKVDSVSLIKKLCNFKFICKRQNKLITMQSRFYEEFDQKMDIMKIVT